MRRNRWPPTGHFPYNQPVQSPGVAEAGGSGPGLMSVPRLFWLLTQLVLICFSSTSAAGEASEYAFRFCRLLLGLGPTEYGLHTLAEKGVHFVLFFALGTGLYHSLKVARLRKVCWAMGICFLAGIGSEGIQLLSPGRHASVADVPLNGASGTLAAMLSSRVSPYSEAPEKRSLTRAHESVADASSK